MKMMEANLYELLRKVDTPTVCNAIELIQGKRGFSNFTKETIHIADVNLPPLVGFARTATIRAKIPSNIPKEEQRKKRLDYYRYMSESHMPSVCVMQDLDFPECWGSFWGEINNNVHKALGIEGVITNGIMRDLDYLAEGYQVIAGGVGPSHAHVHIVDFDTRVNIFGMDVIPGDLIHGDRHGAVVIPNELINSLGEGIVTLIERENIILDKVKHVDKISFEEFELLWKKFEESRT